MLQDDGTWKELMLVMMDLPHQVGVLELLYELWYAVASVCLWLFVSVTICVTGVTLEFLILNSHCALQVCCISIVYYIHLELSLCSPDPFIVLWFNRL